MSVSDGKVASLVYRKVKNLSAAIKRRLSRLVAESLIPAAIQPPTSAVAEGQMRPAWIQYMDVRFLSQIVEQLWFTQRLCWVTTS